MASSGWSAGFEEDLSMLRNEELRSRIVETVEIDTDRYTGGQNHGLRKSHVIAVGKALGIEREEMTISEWYSVIGEEVGVSYGGNAGNDWKFRRKHLKAILEELEGSA